VPGSNLLNTFDGGSGCSAVWKIRVSLYDKERTAVKYKASSSGGLTNETHSTKYNAFWRNPVMAYEMFNKQIYSC